MSNKNPAIETEDYQKKVLEKLENKQKATENIKQYQSEFDNKWNMNNKIIELFVKNIEKDQKMRQVYAKSLIRILTMEIIALIFIFILTGVGILKYSERTLDLFITGGIIEVCVLVRIIVKYLFKDNLTNALNIILENNNKSKYKKNHNHNKTDKPRVV